MHRNKLNNRKNGTPYSKSKGKNGKNTAKKPRDDRFSQVPMVTLGNEACLKEWVTLIEAGALTDHQGINLLDNICMFQKRSSPQITQGMFTINLYNKPIDHLTNQLTKYGVKSENYNIIEKDGFGENARVSKIEIVGPWTERIVAYFVALNFLSTSLDNFSFYGLADHAPILAESFTPNLTVGRNKLKWTLTLPSPTRFFDFLAIHSKRVKEFQQRTIWEHVKIYKEELINQQVIDKSIWLNPEDVPQSRFQFFHIET